MTIFLQIVRRSVSQTCTVWVPTFLLRTGESHISVTTLNISKDCEDEEDWCGAGKNADLITDLIMAACKSVVVLCPNARRQTVKVNPTTTLLQVCLFLFTLRLSALKVLLVHEEI